MSNETLNIEMELGEFEPDALADHVKEVIEENLVEFGEYCARLVNAESVPGLSLDMDSAEIEDFHYDEDAYEGYMSFTFFTDFYAGCKDINSYDPKSAEQTFEFHIDLEKNKIIFDEITLPPAWQPDLAMED